MESEGAEIAIKAWNMMKGIDWQALPLIAEMLGVVELESFITQLITIRNYQDAKEKAENG